MRLSRLLLTLLSLVIVAAIVVTAMAARPAMPAAEPAPASFDPAVVKRGAQLATLGDCLGCHTADNGKPFAGGRALDTPFGTIYGTNITPDPDTGIGRWSQAAFVRAMREGVDREGQHLYPAFPYDHFTHVGDADLAALYAYVMTRDPVQARAPANDLMFPMNFRPLLAVWKTLYFRPGALPPDAAHDAQWNRGAYLVTGLGHCGACHTPRNRLGAEKTEEPFAGGEAEGWHAPALNGAAPAPIRWTTDALYEYLRTGVAPLHDAAGGPMAPVTHNLATAPEQDVRAIAAYMASWADGADAQAGAARPAGPAAGAPAGTGAHAAGRAVYQTACAACHDTPRDAFFSGALDLRLSTALRTPTAANAARIIVGGIVPPDGEAGPWMPAFGGALTDAQLAALLDFLRADVAGQAAWDGVADDVRHAREATAISTTPARASAAGKEQRS